MRDFDKERQERASGKPSEERTFVLGGETFVVRERVRPDVLAMLDEIKEAKVVDGRVVERGTPVGHDLGVMDDFIVELLEPDDGAGERWREIRARTDDPVEMADLEGVIDFATTIVTGRDPTGSESASRPGPARTATRSTGGSSSRASTAASRR